MRATCDEIAQLKGRFADLALEDASKVFNTELIAALELGNMLDVAEAIARCAHARKESRGAHTRKDFTKRDDQHFLHHSLCHFDPAGPRLEPEARHARTLDARGAQVLMSDGAQEDAGGDALRSRPGPGPAHAALRDPGATRTGRSSTR